MQSEAELTQEVLRAVRVIVVVIGEMVDPVTAALVDTCMAHASMTR